MTASDRGINNKTSVKALDVGLSAYVLYEAIVSQDLREFVG